MSTSNFHNVNASSVFACEIESEYDYEDLLMNLETALINFECDYKHTAHDSHELRSYPSRVITALGVEKQYKDFSVSVEIAIIIRSGYYAGCNLDWNCIYSIEGEETNDLGFAELIEYYADCSAKMALYKASFVKQWAESTAQKMINRIEAIFRQYSTPLNVVARFSNGETIYEKAS